MAIMVEGVSKLTYEDYVALYADDRQRHEIIAGLHVVSPAPSVAHQRISKRVFALLKAVVEDAGRGEVFYAPLDVELSQVDVVQPDIIVVLNANAHKVTPSRIKGAPDKVVEILSPGSRAHDTQRKRAAYERAGVPECWLVDPDSQEIRLLHHTGEVFTDAGDTSRGTQEPEARRYPPDRLHLGASARRPNLSSQQHGHPGHPIDDCWGGLKWPT